MSRERQRLCGAVRNKTVLRMSVEKGYNHEKKENDEIRNTAIEIGALDSLSS